MLSLTPSRNLRTWSARTLLAQAPILPMYSRPFRNLLPSPPTPSLLLPLISQLCLSPASILDMPHHQAHAVASPDPPPSNPTICLHLPTIHPIALLIGLDNSSFISYGHGQWHHCYHRPPWSWVIWKRWCSTQQSSLLRRLQLGRSRLCVWTCLKGKGVIRFKYVYLSFSPMYCFSLADAS